VPASSQGPVTPKPEVPDEDYAVYSLVIQTRFVKEGVERIVIADHTLMDLPPVMMGMTQFCGSQGMQRIREAAAKDTVQDYEQKNKSSVPLDKKFSLKVPLALISELERDRIFMTAKEREKKTGNPKGFEEFYRLYPKSPGFMTLSRVGFNPAKTQALLYIGNLCGGLCGSGQFFLLVREGSAWKILYAAMTWVS
jgi:hypothetical protein